MGRIRAALAVAAGLFWAADVHAGGTLITDPGNRAKAEKAATEYITNILKDPDSARFRFPLPPIAGSISTMVLRQSGYFLCGEVNGRNSYGGFTGFKPFLVIFTDITLSKVDQGVAESPGSGVVRDWCSAIYR